MIANAENPEAIYIYTGSVSGYLVYSKIDNIGTSIKCLLCDKL